MNVEQVMTLAPVIPVLVVHDVAHAMPIAEALVAGGLPALEVTLRTPAALDVIRAMAKVKGAVVGAGTVLNADDVKAAVDAGARFSISSGSGAPAGTIQLPPTHSTASSASQSGAVSWVIPPVGQKRAL